MNPCTLGSHCITPHSEPLHRTRTALHCTALHIVRTVVLIPIPIPVPKNPRCPRCPSSLPTGSNPRLHFPLPHLPCPASQPSQLEPGPACLSQQRRHLPTSPPPPPTPRPSFLSHFLGCAAPQLSNPGALTPIWLRLTATATANRIPCASLFPRRPACATVSTCPHLRRRPPHHHKPSPHCQP